MKIKFLPITILLLFFYGCGLGKTEWTIDKLFIQRIEGTSNVIYNFSAWGGLDSNPHGFIILDSTETFEVDVQNILPIYQLSEIPNKMNIEGITHDCYGTCGEPYYKSIPIFKPMKIESSDFSGITLTTLIYQYKGYSESSNGGRYQFDKFKETKDSVYFYNLNDIESIEENHLDELKLKKGEIYLYQNERKEIIKMIAKEVQLNAKTKSIEKISDYILTPKYKTENNQLSERGIFREAKIPK
ncbi:hypothetical protein [Kaistella jeonii]|uniref:Lipoprotein n=1 Tax=Kaistella jeonii TaxID=266749 RepID=A0A0C1EVS5_9FLAO|nr:hypothetical protein [Kaistella jeonii]KIA83948.1 hypothetical protein OA86_14920 [Kaistella jeonii]SFC43099.1 hypothetical protein SAMN05421876_1223 [Kaistella jeonii]VEI96528.1 Uncharacterised protein [Kaistella jeonii]